MGEGGWEGEVKKTLALERVVVAAATIVVAIAAGGVAAAPPIGLNFIILFVFWFRYWLQGCRITAATV